LARNLGAAVSDRSSGRARLRISVQGVTVEAPVLRAIIAIGGSVLILMWPILVMFVRSLVEARRWRTRGAARGWINAWFAGSGIWVMAAWIVVIIGIRLVTSTLLSASDSVGLLSWMLILMAMVIMVPIASRRPTINGPTLDDQ